MMMCVAWSDDILGMLCKLPIPFLYAFILYLTHASVLFTHILCPLSHSSSSISKLYSRPSGSTAFLTAPIVVMTYTVS